MSGTSAAELSITERLKLLDEVFLPSAPIHREDLLAGRQEQRFGLLEMSNTPGGHAAVFGLRGVGKTSLVSVFEADMRRDGVVVVRINCPAEANFRTLITDLALALQDSLPEEYAAWIAEALPEGFGQVDIVRMLKGVTNGFKVLMILDEFDVVRDDDVAARLANLMKALSDSQVDAHLIIVGVAEDVGSIMRGHASVTRGLKQVSMPALEDDELRSIFALGSDALTLTFPPELVTRVVRLSQGLPHYTHSIAKQLARRAILAETDMVALEDWRPALERSVEGALQEVIDLYTEATTTAKPSMFPSLLLAAALAAKDNQGFFRPADVHPHLNKIDNKVYDMASFTGNLASLATEKRGPALQSRTFADGRRRYRFANPLLQPYVVIRAVLDGVIDAGYLDDDSIWGGGGAAAASHSLG
jgi:Cdc6-like AAA superfamily ATPase